MNCIKCSEKAVLVEPRLCRKHFIDYFEKKVFDFIKKFDLAKKGEKVAVACSGGKDSTSLLYVLKKYGCKTEAVAIDEGIKGYRNKTLVDLKNFCAKNKIKLHIYSFNKGFGMSLDLMLKKEKHPCAVCGTFRRYLLNKYARSYSKLATGHNMDDEAQAVLMNLLKGNTTLLRNSTPKTAKIKGFAQKIKPFYFCPEKEVAAYSLLKGFKIGFVECPYMHDSFRNDVRNSLNKYESLHPGVKKNILLKHLKIMSALGYKKGKYLFCAECGEPSHGLVCKACELRKALNKNKRK
jgi:uncharacterized protein (TIGR00269 family)